MSLRWKLALAAVLAIALGFWCFSAFELSRLRPRLYEAMEEAMVDEANLLAAWVSADLAAGRDPVPGLASACADAGSRDFGATIYGKPKPGLATLVYLTDDRGRVLLHSRDPGQVGQDYSRWNDVLRTLRGEYGSRSTRLQPDNPRSTMLHVAAPVRVDGRIAGVLTVAKHVDAVSPVLSEARHALMAAALLAAAATASLVVLAGLLVVSPVRRLTAHVQAVKAGARPPLPPLGRSEIGELGRAFDDLAAELDGRAYIERYVQALAHQLKAPLAAVRASAELLGDDLPPADRTRFLANLQAEAGRMQDLIERLLQLAALERREAPLTTETVPLAPLLSGLVMSLDPLAAQRGIRFAVSAPDGMVLTGETFLLRQALANLLHNALDFSPDGAVVELAAEARNGRLLLTVADRGPGIPDYALPRLGERFFSLPRPGSGRKGSGLGLALAHEVIRRHGGSLRHAPRPGGGTLAILDLPALDRPA